LELRIMKLRPLHDQIIVHRLTEGEQRIGGIIIPDTAKEKPQQGTVVAAGNGKAKANGKRVPLDVKAGDRILFGKYSGQEVRLDGKDYFIMKEDDVLAIIGGPIGKTQAAPREPATMPQKKNQKKNKKKK
jgi:chaperonin GroES